MDYKKESKKFSVIDLTGKNRELNCLYHGKHNLHLEGRIMQEKGKNLVVGVSLHENDVAVEEYDAKTKSLNLFYQRPSENTIRTSILHMSNYTVPKGIKQINVYDMDPTFFGGAAFIPTIFTLNE
ncbi:hypothetical protein HZA97_09495 [Candidatus Woesearchaeota archaeon]|nr:hypothetical protein [Candidatus Woesearchaeota archaeon]